MDRICHLDTPLGRVTAASDGVALVGLWFDGQRHFAASLSPEHTEADLPLFGEVRRWLTLYFQGREPDFTPPLVPRGTAFQRSVWELLRSIPYGETATYGAVAAALAGETGRRVSPRAVGSAVGRNPVSLLIPCHRVVGAGGALTGYAGGLDRKRALLFLEQNGLALT